MRETTQNIALGNARVGVQAGVVHGGVRINLQANPSAELAEALADFRVRLQRAWEAGRLDEDTYAAAQAELTVAEEALETNRPESTSRLTVALKKVRGLIGDVAELAAELALIISLVHGVS